MNITTFKRLVEPANSTESKRLNNLTSRHFKFLTRTLDLPEPTEENTSKIWHSLNKKLAEEDKFHRIQTHEMRNHKHNWEDYSSIAYNHSADDL